MESPPTHTSAAAALPPLLLSAGCLPPKLASPHPDPWLAPDKFQHFAFCFAVTAAGYWAARRYERARRLRLALGCAAGVVAGVLKEVGDVLQVCTCGKLGL